MKHLNDIGKSFTLSLFIVLVRTAHQKAVHGAEVESVAWILIPQLAIIGRLSGDAVFSRNPWKTFSSWVLQAVSCFMCWVFFLGLDEFPKPPCGKEMAFFFAKVELRGWYRTFQKVIWLAVSIVNGIGLLCLRSTGEAFCCKCIHSSEDSPQGGVFCKVAKWSIADKFQFIWDAVPLMLMPWRAELKHGRRDSKKQKVEEILLGFSSLSSSYRLRQPS